MSDKLDVETIKQMVDIAKKIAKENNFELDFSQKSVENLDKLVNYYHKTYVEDKNPDEEEYSGYSLSLGIYIGETLRKLSKHKNLE